MLKTQHLLGTIIALAGMLSVGHANPNACDDYIARHYKKDFKSLSLSFQDREYMGDIHFPHQIAWIRLKNVGQVDFPSHPSGYRRITASVNYNTYETRVAMPVASGAQKTIAVTLPPGTLKHCKQARVQIDIGHTVGQWGCQVWNNDISQLIARRTDSLLTTCLKIGPIKPKPPFKPIQP